MPVLLLGRGRRAILRENTMLIVEDGDEGWLRLDALTLCPIDTKPIVKELLTDAERCWLNDYHARVCKQLKQYLSVDEQAWLTTATAPI